MKTDDESKILLERVAMAINCMRIADAHPPRNGWKSLEHYMKQVIEVMEDIYMDNAAINIVRQYILEHLDKSDPVPKFEVYTVWKAKVLQNWKYLLSSTLFDGMYYELTYNGDKEEWYLDAYKKFENRVVKL